MGMPILIMGSGDLADVAANERISPEERLLALWRLVVVEGDGGNVATDVETGVKRTLPNGIGGISA
ncbi:unnamed protein product [marine sediment metagenome]|uniref:Uncharacterized protein n=1 Tax=marine sediment metagenome TaxID=412755 RepID=X0URA5_9ZZZZ